MLSHLVIGPIGWYFISLGGLFAATLLAALLLKYNRRWWYKVSFTLLALLAIGLNLNKTVTILNDLARSTYVGMRDDRIEQRRVDFLALQTKVNQGDQHSAPKLALLSQAIREQPGPNMTDVVGAEVLTVILTVVVLFILPIPMFSLGFGLTALTWGAITSEAALVPNSAHMRLFRGLWANTDSTNERNVCRLSWTFGAYGWGQLLYCCFFFVGSSLWELVRTVYYLVIFAELRNPARALLNKVSQDDDEGVIVGRLSLWGFHPSPLLFGLGVVAIWLLTQNLSAQVLYWSVGVIVSLLLVDILLWWRVRKRPLVKFRPFAADSSLVIMIVDEAISGVKTVGHTKNPRWHDLLMNLHHAICPSLTDEE